MVIGEFESEELDELINKAQDLAKKFEFYCDKHNKEFESNFIIGQELFKLEIKVKNK